MEATAEDVDFEVAVSSGNSTTSKAGSAEVPNYWAVLLLLVSTRVRLHPIPFIRNTAYVRGLSLQPIGLVIFIHLNLISAVRGCGLRERAGHPVGVSGEAPAEHHQLLHRLPRRGRPPRRRLRHAILRLCPGKTARQTVLVGGTIWNLATQ